MRNELKAAAVAALAVGMLGMTPEADLGRTPVADLLSRSTPEAHGLWGEDGHVMAARAASAHLPGGVPAFFADASDQLAYLNPEPDRWRDRELAEMDQAFSYDHYFDMENVPAQAMQARDRYEFLRILYRETDLERPERDAGLLPFHIMELFQRLVTEWTLWHRAGDAQERAFIEERILNDAGTLGHYVTDAAQPHHSTVHFNGWNASGAADFPNPEGFTTANDFHGRFESGFVRSHVRADAVMDAVTAPTRSLESMEEVRQAVWDHIQTSNDNVVPLYRLEKEHGFAVFAPPHPDEVAFAVERLADGARVLRDLWYSAYLQGRAAAAQAPSRGPDDAIEAAQDATEGVDR
jgi:hypothetical protein